jgi:predicted DNA binding CopG/RHH family protein
MKKPKINNPPTIVLDAEEKVLENALAQGEYVEATDFSDTNTMFKEAAENYTVLNTAKPITIRVNQFDLIKVKAKAKRQQIPYQTLLGSLIHQYAEGKQKVIL